MKKSFTMKFIPVLTVIFVSLMAFSSCTTKNYYESGLTVAPLYYTPSKSQFRWDGDLGRWYYTTTDKDLTEYQLEEMEMAGTVLFGKGDDTDFCPMPYVDSYYTVGGVLVIQTIGFEVTYGKVTFYIQTNEPDITWNNMPESYEFKISLFYWL